MEIIVYGGKMPTSQQLEELVRSAEKPYAGMAVELRYCCSEEQLAANIRESVMREAERMDRYFPLRTADGIQMLKLSGIVYFQSQGHRFHIILTDGRRYESMYLRVSISSVFAPLLANGQFFRISKSIIVNKACVGRVVGCTVYMNNGDELRISESYATALRNACPSIKKNHESESQ